MWNMAHSLWYRKSVFEDAGIELPISSRTLESDRRLLRRYERARREDVASMQLMTHGLQKLFGYDSVLVAKARNLGLTLVNWQPQLKNFLVHHAIV